MEDLKKIIADNLVSLRKHKKLTQIELAETLNYSDKAISKWERGESLPDVSIMKQLADLYGVTLDYIATEHSPDEKIVEVKHQRLKSNKPLIVTVSWLTIWIFAAIIYINSKIYFGSYYWMIWLWAVPASSIILVVFSCIWGKRIHLTLSISLFIWSFILCLFLHFINLNMWPLFIVGVPAQLVIIAAVNIKPRNKVTPNKNKNMEKLDT